eukprot:1151734-Pelagomonas_calceolata.AAC.6
MVHPVGQGMQIQTANNCAVFIIKQLHGVNGREGGLARGKEKKRQEKICVCNTTSPYINKRKADT